MKVFKGSIVALSFIFLLAGCSNYGKEYKLDKKHNVYYKGDGVDEATAKKLANYLKEQSYFQDDITASVQLVKTKDTFDVNFVVDPSKIDSEKEKGFVTFGGYISKNVFDGAPVVINLTNDKLETIKNVGYCPPVALEAAPAQ